MKKEHVDSDIRSPWKLAFLLIGSHSKLLAFESYVYCYIGFRMSLRQVCRPSLEQLQATPSGYLAAAFSLVGFTDHRMPALFNEQLSCNYVSRYAGQSVNLNTHLLVRIYYRRTKEQKEEKELRTLFAEHVEADADVQIRERC